MSDDEWLRRLEPIAARSLERHLATVKDWLPHEWLPWSRGRDYAGAEGTPWTPQQSRLPEPVQAALALNLLTEDNLPGYHHELVLRLGRDGPWGAWVRRWTAEEARHAASLRDYVLLSRAIDPGALERDRMAAMQTGWSANGKGLLSSLAYVTLQERATCVAHRNTGRAARDPVAQRLSARIAADEHLHMVFYRGLVDEALAMEPEEVLDAITQELAGFEMPGAGVPGFLRKSVLIAEAGIYDARIHRDEVVLPLLKHWEAAAWPRARAEDNRTPRAWTRWLEHLELLARRHEERCARRRSRV